MKATVKKNFTNLTPATMKPKTSTGRSPIMKATVKKNFTNATLSTVMATTVRPKTSIERSPVTNATLNKSFPNKTTSTEMTINERSRTSYRSSLKTARIASTYLTTLNRAIVTTEAKTPITGLMVNRGP
ncbi:hypothetical protein OSTOST_21883, partial [Ostertagia ostertagi]